MNISAVPSNAAPTTAAVLATSPAVNSDRIARALNLAAKISDESGAYSEDEQNSAWGELGDLAGQSLLVGATPEQIKTLENAMGESSIGKRNIDLQNQFASTMNAAIAAGQSAPQAAIAFYDSLSPSEQKGLFIQINAKNAGNGGVRPYKDAEDWRQTWLASATNGAGGQTVENNAAATVMALDWLSAAQRFRQKPVVQINLSPTAQATVGRTFDEVAQNDHLSMLSIRGGLLNKSV